MDISSTQVHIWILLVGLSIAQGLSCHLLELALVAPNCPAVGCYFLRLLVGHSTYHEYN